VVPGISIIHEMQRNMEINFTVKVSITASWRNSVKLLASGSTTGIHFQVKARIYLEANIFKPVWGPTCPLFNGHHCLSPRGYSAGA